MGVDLGGPLLLGKVGVNPAWEIWIGGKGCMGVQ